MNRQVGRRFVIHFAPFAVQPDNAIGNAGVKHFADMLKVNTTLTRLVLTGELWLNCFSCLMHVDTLNDCVC